MAAVPRFLAQKSPAGPIRLKAPEAPAASQPLHMINGFVYMMMANIADTQVTNQR